MRSSRPQHRGLFVLSTALLLTSKSCDASDEFVENRRYNGSNRRRRQDKPRVKRFSRHLTDADCNAAQKSFLFSFQTDTYGYETSWFLRNTATNEMIDFGPPPGVSYGDLTIYSYSFCLDLGSTYTLAIEDNFGDGICCGNGLGAYEFSIGDAKVYSTDFKKTFHDYVEHTFTVGTKYTSLPTKLPTYRPAGANTEENNQDEAPHCAASDPTTCGCPDKKQSDYRGSIDTTESGIACQRWRDQTPHTHPYPPEDFPAEDLTRNYCRNPGGESERPWCFTSDASKRWEYCDVPVCGVPTTLSPSVSPTTKPTLTPSKSPELKPTTSPTLAPSGTPSQKPTNKPTPDKSVLNPRNGCYGGDVKVKIEVRADKYNADTGWELVDATGTKIMSQAQNTFGKEEYKMQEKCVPHGTYKFKIVDNYGDGICCRYGQGFFRIWLDDREVLNGGSFNKEVVANIVVGFDPHGLMTERDHQYLEAHNIRRKEWHEQYNKTFVPLVYSPMLAADAKAWAEELLWSCGVVGIEHEGTNSFGENLAKNTGDPETWGQLYPPENIVRRWVDFEKGLPYPSNGHLTAALWRAGKYLGCGEGARAYGKGVCRIQVCRYGRASNCDMNNYDARNGTNWLNPMLLNYTRCGPDCPQEGCFDGTQSWTNVTSWMIDS
ncbi:hypothetical protein ACHAWT_008545 [Skeletonema menzelii]|mmetsp:Transcript_21616/g.35364  ORF Transcript_21616/g.35364 Transcript_21616/m.35364 type:complete len:659 (-) Transcript_21616:19-1995(-)|eukprot:scaffold2205_cov141-Skeletonema_menzelii.AAC.13